MQLQYAELLLSAGRPREAETRLNEILATNPGLPEATRALAFLAHDGAAVDDAKRNFNDLRGEHRLPQLNRSTTSAVSPKRSATSCRRRARTRA